MTAWVVLLPLAAAAGWSVARHAWRDRALPVAVATALALGGYALAGHPDWPARPAPARLYDEMAVSAFEVSRGRLLANYGDVGAWLTLADALLRQGQSGEAIEALQVALKAMPDSPDLWVGLGNALTVHADGMVTPAARLAFNEASRIAPDHPAPRYFLGLAWLQAGQPSEAIKTWEALRTDSPADAPWRPDLERKLRAAHAMQAAGVGD